MYLAAQQPREEAWEHDGICECGKRTYLYHQCPACIEATAKATSPPPDTVAAAIQPKAAISGGLIRLTDGGSVVISFPVALSSFHVQERVYRTLTHCIPFGIHS